MEKVFEIYTDGLSMTDDKTGTSFWGAGAVIVEDGKPVKVIRGADVDKNNNGSAVGKTQAVILALRGLFKIHPTTTAKKLNVKIYSNYDGVEKWATGEWKAKSKCAEDYQNAFILAQNFFNVEFCKGASKEAHELATEAVHYYISNYYISDNAESPAEQEAEDEYEVINVSIHIKKSVLATEFENADTLIQTIENNLPVEIKRV